MNARGGTVPNATTVDVTHGDFVDYIQIRGDIRPAKSIVLSAPLQSGGDLQITKLVKNGATVKKGDIVVEFDATTLRAAAGRAAVGSEVGRGGDRAARRRSRRSTPKSRRPLLMKAQYDVERAKLDLGKRDLISQIEYEEAQAGAGRRRAAAEGDAGEGPVRPRPRPRPTWSASGASATRRSSTSIGPTAAIAALQLRAPADGIVNILENSAHRRHVRRRRRRVPRGRSRLGRRAAILELPDLSSIHLEARLDESDRGRLKVGQQALPCKIEAVPGKDFTARVDLISVLARVDFSSGWPPVRNFDLGLVLDEPRSAHPARA